MNDVFIAIAEGRIDALKVYGTLFSASSSKTKESKTGQETLILKYSVPVDDPQTEERLSAILARAQGKILSRKSTLFSKTKEVRTRVSVRMTPEEQRPLLMALEHSGARDLRLYLDRKRWSVLGVLLLLWGLDSVFAKLLIDAGVSPAAMTLIRTWTCFAAALATVIFQKARRAPTSQISLGDPTLWIAGICFFALAHITHLTLVDASPFLYKTALRGSVLVTTIPLLLRFQKRTASFTAASVMALLGLATIAYLSGTSVTILAVSTAIAFAAYTLASERFQSRERIDMRYPQFFLAISFISAVASLFLMLTSTFMLPSLLLFALAVGFTLIFVCLPYALFFILSHDIDYGSMAPFFHGSIFITFFAQWALLGLNDMFLVPGALFLIAAALIGTQTSSHITHRSMAKRYATNA